ncbi:MAG TPA: glycosyltransferase 87 family protein [Candidatus Dormibacteraeota bacterium]
MSRSLQRVASAALLRPLSRRLVLAALLVLAAFRITVLVVAVRQGRLIDADRFFAIGHAAGRPYGDFPVEYPPVLVALVKLLALTTPDEHAFTVTIIVISLIAEASVAVLLWRSWSRETALWYLTVNTLLLALFVVRLDLLTVALVTGAIVASLRAKPRLAAVCMVLAIGLKLWPLPVALLVLPILAPGDRRKYIVTGLACTAVLLASWLALGGVAGLEQVVSFRGAVGWQIESFVGSFVRLFTVEPAFSSAGAQRFGHVPGGVAPAMQLAALALTVWAVAHVRARRDLGAAWVVSVGGFLLASTLFSPQFVAWLVPAGAIAWASGDALVAAAVAAVALATLFENSYYPQLVAAAPAGTALLLVRNTALVLAIAAGARRLHRSAGPTYSAVTAPPGLAARRSVDDAARAPAGEPVRGSPSLQ